MENGKASDLPQAADNADRMRDKENDNLITGQVTIERWDSDVEKDFCDPDYNIFDEDDDFQEIIAKENASKRKGMPRNVASTSGQLSKTLIIIVKKLNKINDETSMFRFEYSGGPKFRVIGPGGPYVVDLVDKSFTCRRFDLIGLPCTHAYVSIIGNNEKIEKYVNVFYHVDTFKSVYSHYINPTNHEDHWPKVVDCAEILPPKILNGLGGRGADYETSLHVTELPARPSVLKSGEHLKRKSIPNDVITAQNKSAA
ncbi:hypothetical protein FXO38_24249 [Capsicum annuum]|nr:hypothetical protein FXO38_24249 [Capsicum annuum]